ncbi:hypothetical protein NL676_005298 [Syzygium grande]|nr:hypothetical protein NL676_005298 [Syzygium grande]
MEQTTRRARSDGGDRGRQRRWSGGLPRRQSPGLGATEETEEMEQTPSDADADVRRRADARSPKNPFLTGNNIGAYSPTNDVAVNCGSPSNSSVSDRTWIGDAANSRATLQVMKLTPLSFSMSFHKEFCLIVGRPFASGSDVRRLVKTSNRLQLDCSTVWALPSQSNG